MKIRNGFVSNSSSSSWILVTDKDANKFPKESLKEFLKRNPQLSNDDNENMIVSTICHAIHPIIHPDDFQKWRTYNCSNEQSDIDTFLISIGIKTGEFSGNKKNRDAYKKIITSLEKRNKKAYYIIAGQDADELDCNIGYELEISFFNIVDEQKGFVKVDDNLEICLLEFRP